MSLTSEMQKSSSWVNQYFKRSFGKVTEFTGAEGPEIKAFETRVPSELPRSSATRVGTAFDYRMRLALGMRPLDSEITLEGIYRMTVLGRLWGRVELQEDEMVRWIIGVMLCLAYQGERSEKDLAKTAILMAHLDAGFRSGGHWSDEMTQLVGPQMYDVSGNQIERPSPLDVASPREASEIMQLMEVARTAFAFDYLKGATLGPTFAGSSYVGGADADLIVRNWLLDIKTTVQPRRDLPITVRQLIGYALLDWDDEYGIEEVGVYFSRQGKFISWKLDELIERTATDGKTSLPELRREFRELAIENGDYIEFNP